MLLTQAALDDRRARLPLPDRLKGVDQHDHVQGKIIANVQPDQNLERKRESQWSCATYHQNCGTVGCCYRAVYYKARFLVGTERAAISWIWVRDDAWSAFL